MHRGLLLSLQFVQTLPLFRGPEPLAQPMRPFARLSFPVFPPHRPCVPATLTVCFPKIPCSPRKLILTQLMNSLPCRVFPPVPHSISLSFLPDSVLLYEPDITLFTIYGLFFFACVCDDLLTLSSPDGDPPHREDRHFLAASTERGTAG